VTAGAGPGDAGDVVHATVDAVREGSPARYGPPVDLRRLRYFVAVAEEGSFRRAAARLHMAPSPLSRRVRELEASLGEPLFDRDQRRVELTPAGARLLPRALDLLARAERLLDPPAEPVPGDARPLRVGITANGLAEATGPALQAVAVARPDVRLDLAALPLREMTRALVEHRVDLALVRLPIVADERIQHLPLLWEPAVLEVAATDPFADAPRAHVDDVVDRTFPTVHRDVDAALVAHFRLDARRGAQPRTTGSPVDSAEGQHAAVALHGAVVTTPASIGRAALGWSSLLRFVPLDGHPGSTIGVAWRRAPVDHAVRRVAELLRDVTAELVHLVDGARTPDLAPA
jgi:DNA-binding transcriptional LysR family regulator